MSGEADDIIGSSMAEDFSHLAKDFIDRANSGAGPTGTWRLEVLQKRLSADKEGRPRKDSHGDPVEIPTRVRRFLKGVPWAQVHDAIRYLISQSPYSGIVFNGVELPPDVKYRPTLTQWRRDDQEQVGGNAQGSYTLIQDLIEVSEDGDSLGVTSSDSCSETEETEWVWDAPDIEELPYDGGQGVTNAIRQVRRNDDGTFDYAVVTQVAKTTVSDESVVRCDEYETVYLQVFDNVYGGVGGEPFRGSAGVTVDIPEPCLRSGGEDVQLQVSQNPDCTFKVIVQRTVSARKTQATEAAKSLRGVQVTTVTRNSEARVPETGLGVGDRVRNELQPDGRYTTTEVRLSPESVGDVGSQCGKTIYEHRHVKTSNVAQRPYGEASEAGGGRTYERSVRMTDEGSYDVTETETGERYVGSSRVVVQRTLRGVTRTTTDRNTADASASVSKVGDRVEVEKTPGGLFNRTVTSVDAVAIGVLGHECDKTVFEHSHTDIRNSLSDPGPDVSAAGGGKTYHRTVRKTDEGTFDVSERYVEEYDPGVARVSIRKTVRGVVRTDFYRNTTTSSASVSAVGDEVTVERTPGGRFNRTVTQAVKTSVGPVAGQCQRTIFEHVDSTTTNSSSGSIGAHASSAGGGKLFERAVRLTDEGTFDITERVTTENAVTNAVVTSRRTARGTVTSVTDRNVSSEGLMELEVGQEIRIEKTPGGRFNRTFTTVEKTSGPTEVFRGCSDVAAEHVDTVTVNQAGPPGEDHVTAGENEAKAVECRLTDDGTFDVTTKDSRFYPFATGEVTYSSSMANVTEWSGRNQIGMPLVRGGENVDVSVDVTANDHGTKDIRWRRTVYREVPLTAVARHEQSGQYVETIRAAANLRASSAVAAVSGMQRAGHQLSVSAGFNGHGTVDLTVRDREVKYKTWDAVVELEMMYSNTKYFQGADSGQYQSLLRQQVTLCDSLIKAWIRDDRPPSHYSVTPSVNLDDAGRYSGHVTISASWSPNSPGRTGKTNAINITKDYEDMGRGYRVYMREGVGYSAFKRVLAGSSSYAESISYSFDPSSSHWSVTWKYRYK